VLPPDAPDLVALDLLASVAELGSLGRAARRHGISQPAVSMRMTRLERQLGLAVLERRPSGTRLTADGERVAGWSREVLAATATLLQGVTALREGPGAQRGSVRR
jgi:DNA-binding transcriptional LysR family regulator